MRRSTSLQRRLRQVELYSTSVRLSRQIPGPLQRILGQRRSAHDRAGDRPADQGEKVKVYFIGDRVRQEILEFTQDTTSGDLISILSRFNV